MMVQFRYSVLVGHGTGLMWCQVSLRHPLWWPGVRRALQGFMVRQLGEQELERVVVLATWFVGVEWPGDGGGRK